MSRCSAEDCKLQVDIGMQNFILAGGFFGGWLPQDEVQEGTGCLHSVDIHPGNKPLCHYPLIFDCYHCLPDIPLCIRQYKTRQGT